MRPVETASRLTEFDRRGAGTDAERRAAVWLTRDVRSSRRAASMQTFWTRPNWALAHAWHCLLALAGALLMVSHPRLGGALVLAALVSIVADALTGYSPGRRLTREHASQNVVSAPTGASGANGSGAGDQRMRLLVTANYDAGRAGLVYRSRLRSAAAGLRQVAGDGRLTPGWLGWLSIQLVWLLVVAVLRDGGASGPGIGIAQLIPTAALVVELALLLELAGAPFGPAAGDNAAGTAVALALVRALDAAPPRHLKVDLVLQGAGEAGMTGLRRHLRSHRRELTSANTIVLGIGPCGVGRPCWWVSDGPLMPLRFLARLRALAHQAGGPGSHVGAVPHRGRGVSPALPARAAGIPAITIGCVNTQGIAPRSHQAGDVAGKLDPMAMDRLVEFALSLVDAIDADVARTAGGRAAAPAAA
jgi:hypothetical protein